MMKTDKLALLGVLRDPEALTALRDKHRPRQISNDELSPAEKSMSVWLGRLKLLHGVPFNYLVPNTDMLPMESIRFFYCDIVWLDQLQEGALSIGSSTSSAVSQDKSRSNDVGFLSAKGMRTQRERTMGHLVNHLLVSDKHALQSTPIPADEKVTGFLLRSGVVSGWEGLEVEAYSDDAQTTPCKLLRMDHLSPNVLLCMYEGLVKSVRIHEHAEVLHFGVTKDENPPHALFKDFRYIVDYQTHKAGTQVDHAVAPPLQINQYIRPGGSRVIKVDTLAKDMHTTVSTKINYDGPFTAAEFALEMVQGVEAVDFTINYKHDDA